VAAAANAAEMGNGLFARKMRECSAEKQSIFYIVAC